MAGKRAEELTTRALKEITVPGTQQPKPSMTQKGTAETLLRFGSQAALPVAGAFGGAGLGAALLPLRPVLGTFLGEAAGGMAGEAMNQLGGITEPSTAQLLLSGVAAPAGRTSRAIGPLVPPTTKGARFLNIAGAKEFDDFLQRFTPKKAASQLFKEATGMGVQIPVPKLSQRLDELIADLQKRSTPATAVKPLKKLRDKLQQGGFQLTPDEINRELELLGELQSSLKMKGGTGLGAIKRARSALEVDLDAVVNQGQALGMAAPEAVQTLRAARQATLRQKTLDELAELGANAMKPLRGQGEAMQFNAAEVIRGLKKNDFYERAFNASERKEIESLLGKINRIPALPPGAGSQFGSGRFMGRLGSMAAGGLGGGILAERVTGGAIEASEGAAAGIVAGLAVPPLTNQVRVISQALHFKAGRELLGQILKANNGNLTAESLSIVAGFVRAATAEGGPRLQPNQITIERPK